MAVFYIFKSGNYFQNPVTIKYEQKHPQKQKAHLKMKIKYTTIIVKDMDESIMFYRDFLGFEIDSSINLGSGIMITFMKTDGETMIELIKNDTDKNGLYSVGMYVENIHATVHDFKSKGIKIIMEPTPITVGSLAFIEDPNGAGFYFMSKLFIQTLLSG